MKINEKISIKEFDNIKYKIKLFEPENNNVAQLTHFIYNFKNGVSHYHKKDAIHFVKQFLEHIYPTEEITGRIAESAVQYLLFENSKVPFPSPKEHKFTFIDLFAGIGGFRLAMQNLKGKSVFSSEWNEQAKMTYRANFGEEAFGDITKNETKNYIPNYFDILCAGFPCQAFSIAGYRKGFTDTRGTLFFDLEQIIEKNRPKALFLENVKNLQSHDGGKTFKVMLDILENKLKYKVFYKVLNSMKYTNIPQNRERIFIIGFDPIQIKNWKDFKFPLETPLVKTIHDFIQKGKVNESFYYHKDHPYYPELHKNMISKDTVYQWRRVYVRENKSNVCPTLTANMGAGGHNVPLILDDYGIRKLTPKECFAFQGFPVEKYILPEISNSKLYMQAGNSVTMPLIQRVGEKIVEILENN